MHVEISVALNFVISYMYNKLPRRRVDLLVEELEKGLKKKFEGHWYPEKPNKGSGFRCIKINGEEIDPAIVEGATKAGLKMEDIKSCLPEDLTLWIDPSEVSYKLGERGQVKILYSDWKEEDAASDKTDSEVQAASHTFNPEAQTFNPEAPSFTPETQSFTPVVATDVLGYNTSATDLQSFYNPSDPSQSFQTIDSLSSSISNLSLSPSSPVPPPGTWSTATSPSTSLFNSANVSPTASMPATGGYLNPRPGTQRPHFTAAMFAQTKFGSTKLKTNAKRPNRLSPTEFGNFFRQQNKTYSGPPRPRSLSPRDPRVEFLIDQQQRYIHQQHQQQQQRQLSPSMPYPPNYQIQQQQQHQQQQQQQQQHLSQSGMIPDFARQHSAGISSCHSSPHLSPHMSPQGAGTTFQDLLHQQRHSTMPNHPHHHHQLPQHHLSQNTLSTPPTTNIGSVGSLPRPTSLTNLGRAPALSTQQSLLNRHTAGFNNNNNNNINSTNPFSSPVTGALSSPTSQHGSLSQLKPVMSPEAPKSFVDSLNTGPVNYSSSLQHLLMAN